MIPAEANGRKMRKARVVGKEFIMDGSPGGLEDKQWDDCNKPAENSSGGFSRNRHYKQVVFFLEVVKCARSSGKRRRKEERRRCFQSIVCLLGFALRMNGKTGWRNHSSLPMIYNVALGDKRSYTGHVKNSPSYVSTLKHDHLLPEDRGAFDLLHKYLDQRHGSFTYL
jgi:hypothetical protein